MGFYMFTEKYCRYLVKTKVRTKAQGKSMEVHIRFELRGQLLLHTGNHLIFIFSQKIGKKFSQSNLQLKKM